MLLASDMISTHFFVLFISVPTALTPSSATATLLGSKPFPNPLLFKHKFKLIALTVSKATIISYDVIRPFVCSGTLTYVRTAINNATYLLTWVERRHISKAAKHLLVSSLNDVTKIPKAAR